MNYYRLWNLGNVTWHAKEKFVKNAAVHLFRNNSHLARHLIRQNAESRLSVCSCNIHTSISNKHAAHTTLAKAESGTIKKVLKKIGWFDVSKSILRRTGYLLYENVADSINYSAFMKEFKMPDTFYSWFLITELHVWMLMVRVMAEGEEGRFLRNNIVQAMWEDVKKRTKMLGAVNPSILKEQLSEMTEQFQAAMIGYDEGLLTNDRVLAAAVWRIFFEKSCDTPEQIECIVKYIRKQIKILDEIGSNEIMYKPVVKWLPAPSISDIN